MSSSQPAAKTPAGSTGNSTARRQPTAPYRDQDTSRGERALWMGAGIAGLLTVGLVAWAATGGLDRSLLALRIPAGQPSTGTSTDKISEPAAGTGQPAASGQPADAESGASPMPGTESESDQTGNRGEERGQERGDGDRTIYDRILDSTAWVISPLDGSRLSTGTGSIVDYRRKLVITNDHVVGGDEVFVFFPLFRDGDLVNARDDYFRAATRCVGRVVKRDRRRDLALIELESMPESVKAISLASRSARPSDEVHTVGNPGASGALWVYTNGRVRTVYDADYRSEGYHIRARIVETDSPINEGDSGGPVVNAEGELVAVNQSVSTTARLVSNCIDVSEVREFLDEYE